jgi:hypothetical protein
MYLNNHHQKENPIHNSMLAQPANPQVTEDARVPRKHQAPLDANGELVITSATKKKKLGPEGGGKKKTAPEKPKKKTIPQSIPAKAAPPKQKPSVEIEDVDEEDVSSERPRNPWNILEAADGSDDDIPPPAAMAVDADPDEEEGEIEILEAPGEDNEAELGLY